MKRIGTFWSAVCLLALSMMILGTTKEAYAQNELDPARDWTVRLGPYVFNSNSTSNANGSRFGISGHVDKTVLQGDTYDINIGIGYNGYDRVYSIPVLGTIVYHPSQWRFGFGAGYSFNKRVGGRGSNGAIMTAMAGYQLTTGKNPTFLELRYYFVAGANNELDGYALTYGMKF